MGMQMDNPAPQKRLPGSLVALATIIFILVSFFSGIFIGRTQGARDIVPEGEGKVLSQGDIPTFLSDDVDFRQFWDVWNLVKDIYYRQPVSDKDLYYGAVRGMVAAPGDPYTVFFDPGEAQTFQENLEGAFEGIGAEIGIRDNQLQIVAPLPDTPASRAGLMPGDRIFFIDDVSTDDMTVEEAVTRIRGEKGSTVVLGIGRDGMNELLDVPITRDKIVIDSVRSEITEENIAVISIFTFNGDTNRLFTEAVNEALASNVEGIILDLRSNPGGLLSSAISIASTWAGYQPVVIEQMQGQQEVFNGVLAPRLADTPTIVLVNGGSASGSEIVAGALQDYAYATIIGTQTFGKGSVQDYRELPDGSAVKITIAEWLTPLGRSINDEGIAPDIEVEVTLEDINEERDPQKEKAVEILLGKEASEAAE